MNNITEIEGLKIIRPKKKLLKSMSEESLFNLRDIYRTLTRRIDDEINRRDLEDRELNRKLGKGN